jgi:hypothetical protein
MEDETAAAATQAEEEEEEAKRRQQEAAVAELDWITRSLLNDEDPRWWRHDVQQQQKGVSSGARGDEMVNDDKKATATSEVAIMPGVVSRRAREVAAAALEYEGREAKPMW